MYLRNYRLSKSCLEHFQKTAISEILLRLNMLKDPKHLWNLDEGTFIIFFFFFSSLWEEIIWKTSPLSKFEILRSFANSMTADEKYPVSGCENFQFPIQMQLS